MFTADGCHRTGDCWLRIGARAVFLGRLGDMIKTASANVSPAEVEQELGLLEDVAAAHVVALDNGTGNQVVAAAVVLASGSTLTAEQIAQALHQRLSTYKVPKKLLVPDAVEYIPMTHSIKVDRRELARSSPIQTPRGLGRWGRVMVPIPEDDPAPGRCGCRRPIE